MTRDGVEGAREIRTDSSRQRERERENRLQRKEWICNERAMGLRGRR